MSESKEEVLGLIRDAEHAHNEGVTLRERQQPGASAPGQDALQYVVVPLILRVLRWLVERAAVLVAALCLAGCEGMGERSTGLVGQVIIGSSAGGRPPGFFAYDGDTLVAWGDSEAQAQLLLQSTWGALLPPAEFKAGEVFVQKRSAKLRWRGKPGEPMSLAAVEVISPAQIAAWSLTFEADGLEDGQIPPEIPHPEG